MVQKNVSIFKNSVRSSICQKICEDINCLNCIRVIKKVSKLVELKMQGSDSRISSSDSCSTKHYGYSRHDF